LSFWDSLTGSAASDASNAAAQDTYKKQRSAGKDLREYGNQYAQNFQGLSQQYQPYQSAGTDALSMLRSGLGLNGGQGTQAFTQAYQGLPGYQSGLQTGTDAALASANASGRLNSGATLKALQRYGSDYENQRSGDYLTRLMGLQGQGLQATQAGVNTQAQGLQGQLGTRNTSYAGDMNAAGTIGQGMVAGAQAEQQGMQNLMGTAAYLGGAALGGPIGTSLAGLMKPAAASNSTGWNVNPWSTAGVGQMNNAAWG
jgi:hypothetical protein